MPQPRIGPVRFDLLVFPQCLFGNLFACVDEIGAFLRDRLR